MMEIIITKDETKNTVISVGNERKVTLIFVERNSLKKLESFLVSLPDETPNKQKAIDLVKMYLKLDTLNQSEIIN